MVQTTKGGVAPKPAKAKAPKPDAKTPTKTSWVEEHPAGPAAPSEAFNSGH